MAVKDENIHPSNIRKIDHLVFHADEERELDARQTELSGVDEHVPAWAAMGRISSSGAEHMTLVFGTYGSI